jgi:hypothetical protein
MCVGWYRRFLKKYIRFRSAIRDLYYTSAFNKMLNANSDWLCTLKERNYILYIDS